MDSTRRLAAIMFTDIVGYTAMLAHDEAIAIKTVTHHKKFIEQTVPIFAGDIIQFYGDGSLSLFPSATIALECAMAIQQEFQKDIIVPLRIGLHIGELLIRDGNVYGDGVNLASRIESLGQAGTIMFSEDVFQKIRNNNSFKTQRLGTFEFKNVDEPMPVYALANKGFPIPRAATISGKLKKSPTKYELQSSSVNNDKAGNVAVGAVNSKISAKSIAVLPFVNMSSDPEQDFFCEGISEEIINTIVQLPDLKVAGRTSSFCFKGKNEDLRSVGSTLGVSKILEGSVRKSGNSVRVTAQLIEAATGFHLWSKKYDRELDDIFKIQDEISAEIANQLKITLADAQPKLKPREQTKNIDAYQLYNKGRSLFYQRGMSLFQAVKCFREAIELDPDYALAYSGIADTYVMLSFHGYLSPDECWAEAIPAAQKAFKYGPDLGETHNALAVIALLHDRDLEVAEKEFKLALEINPTHSQARAWYGMFFLAFMRGEFAAGIEQFRIAIENDPLSSYLHSCLALTLSTANQFEEAITSAEYGVKLDPDSLIARYNLGYSYLRAGHLEKALQECLMALKISNGHAWVLHLTALTYLKMDQRDEALKIYREMKEKYNDHYFPPSNLAIVAAALGDDEYALSLANTCLDIIDPYFLFMAKSLKDSEALRNIPGFDKIEERFGFSVN
jgi:TolB-like protein/class 3 adenylate cyclase/Tfp pilus assembly protein PilF